MPCRSFLSLPATAAHLAAPPHPLCLNPLPHPPLPAAGMQQRQRLRALDRFKADPTAVLVATDVAARGLDVKDVR